MRRALFLIIVGLGGAAILLALGVWQVQRLAWKEGIIADIEARIVQMPAACDFSPGCNGIPTPADPEQHKYKRVEFGALIEPNVLRVLVSRKVDGAGYRIIVPLVTGLDRRVLGDLGFVRVDDESQLDLPEQAEIVGNLHWPQEVDSFTPEPDLDQNIWFARDVAAMAAVLETEPVLIVVSTMSPSGDRITPMPVDTARIPNNHLQYAITWFSLAFIWLAMSLYFVARRRA